MIVKRHLAAINPSATIETHATKIENPAIEASIADADWLVVTSDNHSSRLYCQILAFRFFVPLLSLGVNISVTDEDMSGEVILVRAGDRTCLRCLRRVNINKIANESHPDSNVMEGLVKGGYVKGVSISEPAVKTLNSIVGNLGVDILINQYTDRQSFRCITVYENNKWPTIYEDRESVNNRDKYCHLCDVTDDVF